MGVKLGSWLSVIVSTMCVVGDFLGVPDVAGR